MLRTFFYIIGLFVLIGITACKVRYTLNDAQIPAEAKSASVILFPNNAALAPPIISQRFTEKLRDVVSSQTNLALKQNAGDLQFEGFISDYNVAPVAIQSGDQAALNRLTISVFVKYSNRFDKTKDFEQTFTRFNDFPSTNSLSSVENSLIEEISRQICEDVFNRAFNNW